jgi:hypothetical protein
MANVDDEYVHYDEFEDVVVTLELVARLAKDVSANQSLWKWIIIAAQNAVQGAMVLALAGTDGCGALTSESQKEVREWLDKPTDKSPKTVMAPYGALLARVQNPGLMNGPPLEVSPEDLKNLERLNDELRRKFAHFNPMGWGIQLSYILNILPSALTTVEFLLETQTRPLIHLADDQKKRIADSIASARNSFAKISPAQGEALSRC